LAKHPLTSLSVIYNTCRLSAARAPGIPDFVVFLQF
jgi:hypothetical protein